MGTPYVILQLGYHEERQAWLAIDEQTATSAEAAIRKHVARFNTEGTFVAVPARSWKPLTVETVQITRTKLAAAGAT